MKNYLFLFLFIFTLVHFSCTNEKNEQQKKTQTTKTTSAISQEPNFDLMLANDLLLESESIEQFEQKINKPATDGGPNNVDRDNDGKIDRLAVSFEGQGNAGALSVYSRGSGEKDINELLASFIREENVETATYIVEGNPQLYGPNAVYQTQYPTVRQESFGEQLLETYMTFMILDAIFDSGPRYSSFYDRPGYDHSRYYRPEPTVSKQKYQTTVNNYYTAADSKTNSKETSISKQGKRKLRASSSLTKVTPDKKIETKKVNAPTTKVRKSKTLPSTSSFSKNQKSSKKALPSNSFFSKPKKSSSTSNSKKSTYKKKSSSTKRRSSSRRRSSRRKH